MITKDAVVEGVHFLPEDPPDLVARKLLRVNLSDLAVGRKLAIGYGILTVENEAQALTRAGEKDRGGAAARACLDMIALKRRLVGNPR